jgi:hypothetical protein
MPTPINRGDDTPQLQRQSYGMDWRSGSKLSEEYKGVNPQKMIDLWNANVFLVENAKMTIGQGMAELTLDWASFEGSATGTSAKKLTLDRWEIPDPKVEKLMMTSPQLYDSFYNLASLYAGGPSDVLVGALIGVVMQGVTANQPAADLKVGMQTIDGWFNDKNFLAWRSLDATSQGYIIRAYNRCLAGITHYSDSTYALRHTTNAPAYWSANVSDVNTNRIYTTAQLLSEVQNSLFWYLPLPGRLAYKLAAASAAFLAGYPASTLARPGYMVGWRKSPFGESSVGRNKIEIQGSYELDQWSLDNYPAAT